GASIWHFVLDGNLASNEMLSAGIVLCTPLMMVFAYLCKLFSREPLIPRGEQFFFFRSGNLDDPPEEFSLPDQNLGWPLWPVIVTLLGLAFGAFQTAWAVFDFPRIKLF
ncbi:MAG: hypothetical protein J0H57_02920, partial [Rhodospirillales bacterium]|nr:hypothetical protein [Rhodospirillales bacterium]